MTCSTLATYLSKIGLRQKINLAPERKTGRFLQLSTPQTGNLASAPIAPLKWFLLMSLIASILLELMGPFMSLSLLTFLWHLTLSVTYCFLKKLFLQLLWHHCSCSSPALPFGASFFKPLFLWMFLKSWFAQCSLSYLNLCCFYCIPSLRWSHGHPHFPYHMGIFCLEFPFLI